METMNTALFVGFVMVLAAICVDGASLRTDDGITIYEISQADQMMLRDEEDNIFKVYPEKVVCQADIYGNGKCTLTITIEEKTMVQAIKLALAMMETDELQTEAENIFTTGGFEANTNEILKKVKVKQNTVRYLSNYANSNSTENEIDADTPLVRQTRVIPI